MANSSANASKKMGTAKTSSKKKNKKPNKKAGRIALLVILCVLVVGMLTTAIIGGYVFFNIVSFAHGEIAINLDDYKANQNQTSFVYAYDSNNELVEMAQLHGEENRIWVDFDKMPKNLRKLGIHLLKKQRRQSLKEFTRYLHFQLQSLHELSILHTISSKKVFLA